jgi:hypothetical protein
VGKIAIGVVAFAAGAAAGALVVKWYVEKHYAALAGEKIGAALFGEGSTGAHAVTGIFSAIDEVRA